MIIFITFYMLHSTCQTLLNVLQPVFCALYYSLVLALAISWISSFLMLWWCYFLLFFFTSRTKGRIDSFHAVYFNFQYLMLLIHFKRVGRLFLHARIHFKNSRTISMTKAVKFFERFIKRDIWIDLSLSEGGFDFVHSLSF